MIHSPITMLTVEPPSRFLKYIQRRTGTIFKISKEEADYIRKHAVNSTVVVVGRHKKARNKTRYVDEWPETFRLLDEFHKQRENKLGNK